MQGFQRGGWAAGGVRMVLGLESVEQVGGESWGKDGGLLKSP